MLTVATQNNRTTSYKRKTLREGSYQSTSDVPSLPKLNRKGNQPFLSGSVDLAEDKRIHNLNLETPTGSLDVV